VRTAQLLLLSFFLANAAAAQTLERSADLRLDDNTPRTARAAALGGTTDALGGVDMAANPATLMNVTRPMLLVQGAYASIGANRDFTRDNVPAAETIRVDASGLSYAAAARPIGSAVLGVYYAAVPRQAGPDPLIHSFGTAPYQQMLCLPPCGYLIPVHPEAFERIEHRYGLALAWKLGPFDLGAGAEMQRIREVGENVVLGMTDFTSPATVVDPERLIEHAQTREVVPNVGVRWRATPRLALAASYTGAGSLTRSTLACNAPDIESPVCSSSTELLGDGTLPMPDTLRAGVSVAATERLRLLAEGVRRGWGRQIIINVNTGRNAYHDTTEIHAGAEYKLGSVALRAGWWRDPAHIEDGHRVFADERVVTHRTIGAGIEAGHGARLDLAYDDASLPYQRRAVVGLTFGL
jgi:hypothetical protein